MPAAVLSSCQWHQSEINCVLCSCLSRDRSNVSDRTQGTLNMSQHNKHITPMHAALIYWQVSMNAKLNSLNALAFSLSDRCEKRELQAMPYLFLCYFNSYCFDFREVIFC